ncbi:FAD-dependent oxidoreductase [Endozoicomonas sp.]|nr:FAD-dependent oxidoreductase [Endozoicomonas sp.]
MAKALMKIAVIGSGISGLSCAWLLSDKHDVTLFEKDPQFGGHSHTVTVEGVNARLAVDTGFIVYNEQTYPNLVQFFKTLQVDTQATEMSFGVSLQQGAIEYSGTSFNTLFAQRKNILSVGFWKMLLDIRRFYSMSGEWLESIDSEITLGQLVHEHRFGQRFIHEHIIPMGAAIWSTPADKMLDYPALSFLRFCQNHGLLQLTNRPQWRTVTGGSRAYVNKIVEMLGQSALHDCCVSRVTRSDDKVVIHDRKGDDWVFDHVVLATHADTSLSLLDEPDEYEQSILSAFSYQRNKAVLHSDERLMPVNRRVWSSWNYHGGIEGGGPSLTYWMNVLQGINDMPLFVTLNPSIDPDTTKVHGCYLYDHPVFDHKSHEAQTAIWSMQGHRRTWYCGAHLGHGFHEDGIQSGLAVAESLGGVKRPWQLANENDRLAIPENKPMDTTEHAL